MAALGRSGSRGSWRLAGGGPARSSAARDGARDGGLECRRAGGVALPWRVGVFSLQEYLDAVLGCGVTREAVGPRGCLAWLGEAGDRASERLGLGSMALRAEPQAQLPALHWQMAMIQKGRTRLWRSMELSVGQWMVAISYSIDLVDEAAAKLKMEITSKPVELDEVDREIIRLEMEKLSLKSDTDKASKERLSKLEADLARIYQAEAEKPFRTLGI
ncbi:hypothetical protein ABZP36_023636 [Zizania latifolia]